jgi:hypothetical protein
MFPIIIDDVTGKTWAIEVEVDYPVDRLPTPDVILRWTFVRARSSRGGDVSTLAELSALTSGSIDGMAISKKIDELATRIAREFGSPESKARALEQARHVGEGMKKRAAVDACPECLDLQAECRTCGGFRR